VLYSSDRHNYILKTRKLREDPRHEIAFVFGQLLSPHSVPSLLKVLENITESDMVRHEAAEALGSIATPEVLPHLKAWMNREDAPRVVRESCQVAIDMWEVRI
jgi:deoxyhypusine monooxygenase